MDKSRGGGVMTNRDIIDELVRVQGLVEGALGRDYLDLMVYDRKVEFCRHVLDEVYLYNDVNDVLTRKFERREMNRVIKTIFRTFTEAKTQTVG